MIGFHVQIDKFSAPRAITVQNRIFYGNPVKFRKTLANQVEFILKTERMQLRDDIGNFDGNSVDVRITQ